MPKILKGAPKPRVREFGRKTISVIPTGANGNFGHTGPGLSWEVGWGREAALLPVTLFNHQNAAHGIAAVLARV